MNLIRPTIQLHTIEQWFSVPPEVRAVVLQNIKLKDRLQRWLMAQSGAEPQHQSGIQSVQVPCRKCEGSGHITLHPRRPGIHPSQFASPCLLKIYYEMKGMAKHETIEAPLRMIFDLGHALHAMFQDYGMRGAWGDPASYVPEMDVSEEPLAQALRIEGHADADSILTIDDIDESPIFEVGIIHEYKTINDGGFKALKGKPKPEHKIQASIYAATLNRPVVVYLYFNKNDASLQDFPIAFDPEVWRGLQSKAEMLVDCDKNNVAPPANVGYHCQKCAYVYGCQAYAQQSVLKR